jgi:homoserine dehydrogenase
MSTLVVVDGAAVSARPRPSQLTSIALLGCGNIGSAFARLLASDRTSGLNARLATVLVRHARTAGPRRSDLPLTTDASAALASQPDVVVELLGGLEPARTLILTALRRGIPVVTANKTLLARHGAELRAAAAAHNTPLLYEASVLAGVPFLGTFARRPLAARATSLLGIVNGTTNFLLTQAAQAGSNVSDGLPEATRLGYAEPDPSKDLSGADAAEKLAVLLQHFAHLSVDPDAIATDGIADVSASTLTHARELGGVIKPVIWADWSGSLEAFVAPAFVPGTHPLARVDGVENALLLGCAHGRLLFQGPGAGPDATAITVLDDVAEIVDGTEAKRRHEPLRSARAQAPDTGWFLPIEGSRLPRGADVADYLGSFGVYVRSSTRKAVCRGVEQQAYLTWPASTAQIESATGRLSAAAGCDVSAVRALGELE